MEERKDNSSCNDKDKYVLIGIDLASDKDMTALYNPITKEYAIV